MIFNPFAFLISRTIAKNQGVADATATTDGFVGGIIKPPVLGIVLVSAIARNQASSGSVAAAPPSLTPRLVAAAASATQINLIWSPVPGATYNVKRGTKSAADGGKKTQVADASELTDTSFSDTELKNDTTYYYLVEAVDSDGNITPSKEASAKTDPE